MTDENKSITTAGQGTVVKAEKTDIQTMFDQIMRAAENPNVDPAKMTALVDLQMKMMDYNKLEQFNQDKIAALFEMPSITKRGAISNSSGKVQSRYSKFEDIHKAVKPILARHNLAISFDISSTPDGRLVTVTPILSHANGYVEKGGAMPLAVDTTGSKNATQGAGSAGSYGKRHTMKAMLNIVEDGEDNDAATTSAEDDLIADGQNAASCGVEKYQRWWTSDLTKDQQLFLVNGGHHERNKKAALKHDADQSLATE